MSRHFVTSTKFDFSMFAERKASDGGPLHVAHVLSERLGAKVHQPGDVTPNLIDRAMAKIVGTAEHWAVARQLVRSAEPGDLVYATGSDCGLPIALANLAARKGLRVAVYYVAPHRTRSTWLTKIIAKAPGRFLAVTGSVEKVEHLEQITGGKIDGVVLADEQTDTGFFSPPSLRVEPPRPLIVSCGLEQRDYVTLRDAVSSLDVEVKICAASPNFTSQTEVAMPDTMPDHVEMRLFEFPELRELYQQATVTVISLLDNNYSAGLTVLMEAVACGSPVVMTRTAGLGATFIDDDLTIGVPPGDADTMRRAIEHVLSNPEASAARAARARDVVLSNHTSEIYINRLAEALVAYAEAP